MPPWCCCGRRSRAGVTGTAAGRQGGHPWSCRSARRRSPGRRDASGRDVGEIGVQLDAQPVPAQALGDDACGAGADERVEHDAWHGPVSTAAAGLDLAENGEVAELAVDGPAAPRQAASGAGLLGAARQEWCFEEAFGEGGVVAAAEGAGRLGPDVARVLAQRVAGDTKGSEAVEARVVACQRTGPGGLGIWSAFLLARGAPAAVRHADGVEVEEVAGRPSEQVDRLPGAGQTVGHRGWHRVGLGPDDLVAHDPAVAAEGQQQLLGGQHEALGKRAVGRGAGVAVAEVEPDDAGGLQDAGDLGHHGAQAGDPGVDVRLQADLARHLVVAEPEVGRAGQDAVDGRGW